MKHLKYYKNFVHQKKPAKSANFQFYCLIFIFVIQVISAQLIATQLENIYKTIRNDDLDNAHILLQEIINSEYANSELFYLQGMLEPNGEQSLKYYLKALELGSDKEIIANSLISACRYYLLSGMYDDGLELINKYHKKCKRTDYYLVIIGLKHRLSLAKDDKPKSDNELRKLLKKAKNEDISTEVLLTLTDRSLKKEEYSKSLKYLSKIVDLPDKRYELLGLTYLIYNFLNEEKIDNSLFSYEALVKMNPNVLGINELSDLVNKKQVAKYEKLAQRLYAVRIGKFPHKKDAEKLAYKFRTKGYSINVSVAQISGRRYFVVDLGRFSSQSAAAVMRDKLERRYNDNYSIVSL